MTDRKAAHCERPVTADRVSSTPATADFGLDGLVLARVPARPALVDGVPVQRDRRLPVALKAVHRGLGGWRVGLGLEVGRDVLAKLQRCGLGSWGQQNLLRRPSLTARTITPSSGKPVHGRPSSTKCSVARLRSLGARDEVCLRTEAARVRAQGFASANSSLIDGMAGVAVPVFDGNGRVVAAFSVGALTKQLNAERLPVVVALLQREAQALATQINPLDRALRRPSDSLG